VLWAVAFGLVSGSALSAELTPPPTEFVTDAAGVLPPETEAELNAQLEAFEQESSNQVVVYVDHQIPNGWELEEFAADAFEAWGIGQADRDNGVLFVVFTEDRRARIEVGYGLEGALPDALAGQILEEQAIPRFREGEWAAGIENAVDGIIAATRGEYEGTGESGDEEGGGDALFFFVGIVMLFQLLRSIWWRMRQSRRGLLGRTIGPTGWLSTYIPVASSGSSSEIGRAHV
jgi:uncharacterized protein